jgi:hypothetical protein
MHGGLSTGPKTPDGREKQIAATKQHFAKARGDEHGHHNMDSETGTQADRKQPVRKTTIQHRSPAANDPTARLQTDTLAAMSEIDKLFEHPAANAAPEATAQATPDATQNAHQNDNARGIDPDEAEAVMLLASMVKDTSKEAQNETGQNDQRQTLEELFGIKPGEPEKAEKAEKAEKPAPPKPRVVARNDAPHPQPLATIGMPVVIDNTRTDAIVDGRMNTDELAGAVKRLARETIRQMQKIVENPLDSSHPHFAAWMRLVASSYNTSMSTLCRVDETAMRKQEIDRMPEILRRVEEERRLRDQRIIEGSFRDVTGEPPDGAA